MEDSQTQLTQTLSMTETNGNISVTPRIKRRQNSTQNDVSMDRSGTENNTLSFHKAMEVTGMKTAFNKKEEQNRSARERSTGRRAALSPAEAEEQRILNSQRNAVRRVNLTGEEIEQQRILAQERSAARRVSATEKEIQKQRALAAERMITVRATASPIVAEEQRVQARNRSTTRRANNSTEEGEQHRALVRQKYNREKTSKQKNLENKRGKSQCAHVEWPRPADLERKKSCLENFIQQMSMSSLAQSVCGICNIRCYNRNVRCVPLDQIPSIELLETHQDLRTIINNARTPQELHFKTNNNMNGNMNSSGVPNQAG